MLDRKAIRRLRHITKADVRHGYSADIYVEYSDGKIEFIEKIELKMNQTNVRLRDKDASAWEEKVSSCPGWFRCDPPQLESA